jgi:DinB superfamily
MRFKRIATTVALAACYFSVIAASNAQTPAPSVVVSRVDPAKSLDAAVTGLEKQLVPLAEAMPADKYNFAPGSELFKAGSVVDYKGVRTFGQLLAHIIQANDFFFLGVGGVSKPDAATTAKLAAIGKLTQKDDLIKALKESFANAHVAVASLTPENAWEHAGRGATDTRTEEVTHALGHAYDIYGQLVEYLRMNAIVPPASQGRPLANPQKTN